MKNNSLSIIIIAYNEERYISGILNSLIDQSHKNFEVIVVDSNSTDNTETVAKKFSKYFDEFRFLKLDEAKGPAYGRNKGAEIARYDKLLFLDADTLIKNDFIERITRETEYHKVDVGTCPIRIAEKEVISNIGAYFLNLFLFILNPFYSSAYGACLFSTKKVHLKVGGFDENIGVCEDCNYVKKARRLYKFKFRIFKPYFYTSDRRAKSEGGLIFMWKYIKIHLYRMLTGKEILVNSIKYDYGNY